MGKGSRIHSKLTTNHCFSLEIHWIKKHDFLQKGCTVKGNCQQRFTNSGRSLKTSITSTNAKLITLTYKINGEKVSYSVPVDYSACNFGGERPWFRCPNINCKKRVGTLFLRGQYFLCRHCHGLAYKTQMMSQQFRLLEKAQKVRGKLGGDLSTLSPFPAKPKGMHWNTYYNLKSKAMRNEDKMWGVTEMQVF
ncbi:hypothetical protein GA0061096_4588 [Fictibacillus enclensis]|uniref:Uncharacterized protein n=1 Tax=Fictibacillus enclensis TaxID=1017270 RepID=A0A0V8IUM9_9BACL|nr:hypothetical protein [Fictibacillus enclensis]KSU78477.1 hypothetical protein AS030_21870 [Fictibacillus enclensis]SCC40940.1 hypothetical protein GA0061096_4588 [Fictibacillus enclensis]